MIDHRAHDYRFLVQRWRAVARRAGLRLQRLASIGKLELYFLRSPALGADNGIYLSAGIHGDEAGSTEALITWAERHAAELRDVPVMLFPCLNPWGLINNIRFDETGLDLNRAFHRDDLPFVAAMKRAVGGRRFALSLLLHEDYDGQGLYLYEVQNEPPFWGESLLQAASHVIPIEGRTQVDGRKARGGVIRRKVDQRLFGRIGYPEAIWLHLRHSLRTFTVETPSEFALSQRIEAHVAVIEEAVQRVLRGAGGV